MMNSYTFLSDFNDRPFDYYGRVIVLAIEEEVAWELLLQHRVAKDSVKSDWRLDKVEKVVDGVAYAEVKKYAYKTRTTFVYENKKPEQLTEED